MEDRNELNLDRVKSMIVAISQKIVRLPEVSNRDLEAILRCHDGKILSGIPEGIVQSVRSELERRAERRRKIREVMAATEPAPQENREAVTNDDIGTIIDVQDLSGFLQGTEPVAQPQREPQKAVDEVKLEETRPEIKQEVFNQSPVNVPDIKPVVMNGDDDEDEEYETANEIHSIDPAENEERLREQKFEEELLRISELEKEPKKEDYSFSDEEWKKIIEAWKKKHPQPEEEKPVRLSPLPEEKDKEENDDEENDDDEDDVNFGWLKWLLILLIVAALGFGGFFAWKKYDESRKTNSLNDLSAQLVIETNQSMGIPTIEAGEKLTYSDSDKAEMKNIPDQLRNFFVSFPEGADVQLSEIDTDKAGIQEVTVIITKEDSYGQIANNNQVFEVNIVDTKQPEIYLNASAIEIEAKDATPIEENVVSVIDPVFGEYSYSAARENRTYYIETSEIDFEVNGTYQAYVIIQDNGNEYRQSFDVTVTGGKKPEAENTANNVNATSRPATRPSYTYVDESGNMFTEEQAREMAENDGNVVLLSYDEYTGTFGA
ncbi:MAG: hypothetical protein IKF80_10425 [Erysipelotrichaceae bacterium]|nr:hypothetical protein [Erysipelotrichaceae bacterium]